MGDSTIQKPSIQFLGIIFLVGGLLTGCAHPIVISPSATQTQDSTQLSQKKVAYVISDIDRSKEFVTGGGAGDKIKYFPYRDLEDTIKASLASVYSEVHVVDTPLDTAAIQQHDISLVFDPELVTSSSSTSLMTWPPTYFDIELAYKVTDSEGNMVSRVSAAGAGEAEYAEFKQDYALAARRAAANLAENLSHEIRSDPRLQ